MVKVARFAADVIIVLLAGIYRAKVRKTLVKKMVVYINILKGIFIFI